MSYIHVMNNRSSLAVSLTEYLKGSILAVPMLVVALATGSFWFAAFLAVLVVWPYASHMWDYFPFDTLEEGIFMAAICVFCFLYYQAVLWLPNLFKLI